ncbi:hypothetical protein N665_0416s0024 [Sinapis alba]|nr:hypothetical protein N665_0416s0024 [Sinapis alba]
MQLWELESTSTGLTPGIETATKADLTIRSLASQEEATKHQIDEPFNRTNMEAYIILGTPLPATQPLKPNGTYGRQSYFTKDKQSRNIEKIETTNTREHSKDIIEVSKIETESFKSITCRDVSSRRINGSTDGGERDPVAAYMVKVRER